MCVGSLDHLDNCKSFGVFNIFKSMFKNGYMFSVRIKGHSYTRINQQISQLQTFLEIQVSCIVCSKIWNVKEQLQISLERTYFILIKIDEVLVL